MPRVRNTLLLLLPAIVATIITVFVGFGSGYILAFLIVLDMVVAFFITLVFISHWRKDRLYRVFIKEVTSKSELRTKNYRVSIVIPLFNEPPDLVVQTAIASKLALGDLGDIYILDDSTDEKIKEKIDRYSEEHGFIVIRRDNRRGYKAGAINNWLRKYGSNYELLMIVDADQRIVPGIFEKALPLFDDSDVAFVQFPQYYSDIDNTVALSAQIQQIPFLRVTMRGRDLNETAFSLGSGTIYRIRHLMEIGGLYEETVTEDIATSIRLHEKGYRSRYVDLPFVWYGVPPKTLGGYISQQNRWALGSYQVIRKLINANMPSLKLLDYLNGIFYWLHVGILTVADLIAPAAFLIFDFYFMRINALNYLLFYMPVFFSSIILYLISMRKYRYGLREFMYHHGIQLIASLPVTIAMFQWIFRAKKGFKVTPKKGSKSAFTTYHLYYLILVVILAFSFLIGIEKTTKVSGELFYAYLINLFWALWWLLISIYAFYISLALPVPKRVVERVSQSYEGLEYPVIRLLRCAVKLESSISSYYHDLSKRFPDLSKVFDVIASDSAKHAKIYSELLSSIKGLDLEVECDWLKFPEKIESTEGDREWKKFIFPQEELTMLVYANLTLDTCKPILKGAEMLEKVMEDEDQHEKVLRELLEK